MEKGELMKYSLSIILITLSLALSGQHTIRFETGDHIYYLEDRNDVPMHYVVDREKELDRLNTLCGILTENGKPECEVWYDPNAAGSLTIRKGSGDTMYVQSVPDIVNSGVRAVNYEPATQPIFHNGEKFFPEDCFLEVHTPQLTRATSFRIHTSARVFVIIKNQSETAKEL